MDKRKIDFTAERERRRNNSFPAGEESEISEEFSARESAQEEFSAEPGDIPEYLKILYGADAARHMYERESPVTAETASSGPAAVRRNQNTGIYGEYDGADDAEAEDFDDDADVFEDDENVPEEEEEDADDFSEEPPKPLSEREKRKRLREAKLDEKLREPIRPMSMDRKKRKRNAMVQLAAILLIAAVIIAVIISAVSGATRNSVYNLSYITMGDLVKSGSADAFYVRQNEVLTAESGGVFVPNVNEGDRVSAGYIIGYITKDEYVSDLTQLRNLDRVILSMQSISGLSPEMDVSKLEAAEAEVAAAKKELTQLSVTGNLEDCSDILVKLTAALNYYNDLLINADTDNASVSQLQKDREVLAARLENNMIPVTAVQSGIVSFYITGRESAENTVYQQLSANVPGDLSAFTSGTDLGSEPVFTVNKEVGSGEAVAKIITSQEYYIVLNTDEDYTDYLGKRISLAPANGRYSVSGTIYGLNSISGGKTLVVKASKSLRASLAGSGAHMLFDVSKTEGYRVPLTALGDWDKTGRTARIALVKANTVKFVYVTVVDTDENFAIIRNNSFAGTDVYYGDEPADENEPVFRANDCYIINAGNVKEGQIIT